MKLFAMLFFVCFNARTQPTNERNFRLELNSSINSTLSFMEGYKSMLGFGVGALVEFRKSSPFRISSGLEYNQTNQGLNHTYFNGKNVTSQTSKKAKMQFISIPINFNHYIGSSQRLLLSSGLIIDYMIKVERSTFNALGEEIKANSDYRVINFAPFFGIGWIFPKDNLHFILKSDVRLGIFPLFDGGSTGKYGMNHYARIVFGVKF